MRKAVLAGMIALLAMPLFTGCAMVAAPVYGGLVTQIDAPLAVTSNEGSAKMGTSYCTSILGIVATGDASIRTAMANGGITKIHHVDYKATSFLGLYAKFTTVVYGE